MDFIIRAEGECVEQLRYHLAIMPAVGVTDHCTQGSTIGWPGGLPFFNEVAQCLLTDYRINDFSHNPFRVGQCGICELKKQILLPAYALQILKQLALNFPLRTGVGGSIKELRQCALSAVARCSGSRLYATA